MAPVASGDAFMSSVSCASAGGCGAVGYYSDSSSDGQGMLFNESSGAWTDGVAAGLPVNASRDPQVSIDSVSCASAGNCSAVGSYMDNLEHQQGLLLRESAGVWSSGIEAVLPANAAGSPEVGLRSVSCSSSGSCAAVGTYLDSSNSPEGLLFGETAGVWSSGAEAILPADAASGGSGLSGSFCDRHSPCVGIDSVSCASAGNCVAGGNYNDSSGNEQGLLLSESSGVWARGAEVTPPADAAANSGATVSSVSCASPGNCSAVGSYVAHSSGGPRGLLVSEKAGVWSRGIEAVLPANAASYAAGGPDASLDSVWCTSPGSCVAVGSYDDGSNTQGLLLGESSGMWSRGVEATLPADAANNSRDAGVSSVSCASAGYCAAVGSYHDSSGNPEGLLLSESAGVWSSGVEATLPANAANAYSLRDAGLGSVSCTSAGSCVAVGTYLDSGSQEGLLVTGTLVLAPHSTTITRARINRKRRTASFRFTAAGATRFQCALVKPKTKGRQHKKRKVVFRSCASPETYRHLRPGRYTFEVRGVNSAGFDPKPATKKFRI